MVGGGRVIVASKKFRDALKFSHTATTRVVLLTPTESNSYVDGGSFSVVSGSLNIDGRRNIRRQGSLVLAPDSGFRLSDLDVVTDASRIRLERGIQFTDGTVEWVAIATLTVQSATRSLQNGGLQVSAYDTSSCIDDYTLITPYAPIGVDQEFLTTVAAIKDLVDAALWETAVWHIGPGVDEQVKPQAGTVFTGSRWDAINNLAKSLSAQVYADPTGEWHIERIQTDAWVACEVLSTGENGVIIDGTTSQDRRDLSNAVPLRWEGPAGGGLVFVVDADPVSPTFWNGSWGRKPSSEQRVETVTTQQQAVDAAKALLAQLKGFTATIKFSAVHNPLLEPGDVVEVVVPDYKLHQLHVIDSIDYSLTDGSMNAETRAVQSISVLGLAVVA